MSDRPGEFDIIRRHFAPLAAGNPAGLDLRDDAALLPPSTDSLAVTTDTSVEGVHFPAAGDPALIARRLLRVNLSDLAAMGAVPVGYFLNFGITRAHDEAWVVRFCTGLAADQTEFGIVLMGGDTVVTPGPLTLTVTAMGRVPAGKALRRAAAQAGDTIFVTGPIGDGALGLAVVQERLDAGPHAAALTERFWLPTPRLDAGLALRGRAHAAADISDGLIADLGHVATASGLAAEVDITAVPLSEGGKAAIASDPTWLPRLLSGGDDYELVVTGPAGLAGVTSLIPIGRMTAGSGVLVRDAAGRPVPLERTGYRHF